MIILGYNQLTEDLEISSSSIDLDYGYEKLFDAYGTQVFKFTGYSDEWIKFDAGSGNKITMDCFGIYNHNIDDGATITIEGSDSDSWSPATYSRTLTWNEEIIFEEIPDFEYRYARFHIVNSAADPIEIGIIQGGSSIEIPNVLSDISFGTNQNRDRNINIAGGVDGSLNSNSDFYIVKCRELTNAFRKELRELWKTNGDFTPVFADLWENNHSLEGPMYCVIEDFSDFQKNHYKYDVSFRIRGAK